MSFAAIHGGREIAGGVCRRRINVGFTMFRTSGRAGRGSHRCCPSLRPLAAAPAVTVLLPPAARCIMLDRSLQSLSCLP